MAPARSWTASGRQPRRADERNQFQGRYQGFGTRDDPRFSGYGGVGRRPPPARTVVLEADDLPELTPICRIVLVVIGIVFALGIAGGIASNWETILLWVHQVTFAPAGAPPVIDPIFGRDIGFFLFELPFLRLLQGVVNGLVLIGALLLALARYRVGVVERRPRPCRHRSGSTWRSSAGSSCCLVAIGYQLDKLELVYSNRGVATGVSFTDQNAQFLAFDVLTVIAALAGAFLVGGAFTRLIWPLGLVDRPLARRLDRHRAALPGSSSSASPSSPTSTPRRAPTSTTTSP